MERESILSECLQIREGYLRDSAAVRAKTSEAKAELRSQIMSERENYRLLLDAEKRRLKSQGHSVDSHSTVANGSEAVERSAARIEKLLELYEDAQADGIEAARIKFDSALEQSEAVRRQAL